MNLREAMIFSAAILGVCIVGWSVGGCVVDRTARGDVDPMDPSLYAAARDDLDHAAPPVDARDLLPRGVAPLKAAVLDGERDIPTAAIATTRYLGGNPSVRYDSRPIAGVPWSVVFTTKPTAPYPEAPMRLLISLTPPGHEAPVVATFHPGDPGVTQQGGKLWLDVTWPPQWIGLRLWLQAVMTDERSLTGETATPVLEVTIGEQ